MVLDFMHRIETAMKKSEGKTLEEKNKSAKANLMAIAKQEYKKQITKVY